ncbi:DUF6687 family protein [Rufibacter quisquiliarum]|uniref:Uncharacterized protein n=1 Tax=Rufibacter quisquiliarum TaxID=1549639 RepID=A0A839GMP3_9BACT|nr:DUF6687 family protein [Rufibacter quisquiliarum]MBA9076226.1 hypothetical protein [Rufibacter quisquiliarum]
MAYSYLPFPELKKTPAVVVDSFHPNGLVLSHWRGAPVPDELREDTSAGMVLQALKQDWPELKKYHRATANHFDIDALVGVWALLNPVLAGQHEELLRQVAIIGDFRELNLSAPHAEEALQLVCWINAEEKSRFYPPFGAYELEENEVVASIPKFEFFLQAFTEVLLHPQEYRTLWQPEFEQVMQRHAQMHGPETNLTALPALGLVVLETPEPVHYYALFSRTAGFDIVLACYQDQRYEVECKYTTWVDIASRPTLPRPDLRPLARHLNSLETSGRSWAADGPTDTGPLLRLQGQELSKAQRYGNPQERPVYSSSLTPAQMVREVSAFLEEVFREVKPKKYWTWAEVREFNLNSTKK